MNTPDSFIADSHLDYPQLIHEAREARDDAWREYFAAQKALDKRDAELEMEAQDHPDLSNNTERKAWVELQKHEDDYVELEREMADAKRAANEKDWLVKRLKNERDLMDTYAEKGVVFA